LQRGIFALLRRTQTVDRGPGDVNREEREEVCHPRCFCQRVRKLLKINDWSTKKSGKREKECASY
jgi:hypothetical protein